MCARKQTEEKWYCFYLNCHFAMDQATVIVGVQVIADVQRDDYNRNGTLISAAGAHASCPNVVYASMLINGYTSETYNICESRVYRTKKPRRRALVYYLLSEVMARAPVNLQMETSL